MSISQVLIHSNSWTFEQEKTQKRYVMVTYIKGDVFVLIKTFSITIQVSVNRCLKFFKNLRSLTLSYTGFFRLVLHGRGGGGRGGHKVPAAFFSETVKATAIKLGALTN